MMQKGWKLEYADNCHNSTHCPETCGEFLRQRRRWVLSELSNMMLIFQVGRLASTKGVKLLSKDMYYMAVICVILFTAHFHK